MATSMTRCPNCGSDARLALTAMTKDGKRLVRHVACDACGCAFKVTRSK